jgi:hypothetical protein
MKIQHTLYFVTIGLLSFPQLMSGQDQKAPNAILKKQLETYDNPPAYIYRLETGPRMIVPYGPFVSYQANVDANGNNIVGDAANECSIAVDPTNRNKMVIGWRQFNSVTSNFRQGGWGYTTDAGLTWHFPGVLENNVFRSDPVLSFDETGKFFYNSLLQSLCDNIYRSINGGQSWTELQGDGAGGGGDKQWFTIDKTNGIGHGFQYQDWDTSTCTGSGQFSRSTNGGATWQATINLPNSIQFGTLDVDTNGNLFVGGEPGSGGGGFYCLRSSNAQNGSQTPTFDRITNVNLGGQLNGGGINPAGLDGQSFLAIDKSGGSTNNNVYMLASVTPNGQGSGTEVMFVRSTNGGQTFSAPVRITDDPVVVGRWHWFGTFAVAPNGRLDAVWYDTRNSGNNINSQLFYSYSIDAGVTWSPNVAVTPAFNPQEGYPNQSKIGDYITMVSDNTGSNVAYSATFNFNPSRNQHEEDVYYVHVQPPSTIPQSAVSRKMHGAAGNFDVDLPLAGAPGIECRSGGATNDYTMVVTFGNTVTVNGNPQAQVTAGAGDIGSGGVPNGGVVTVNGAIVTIPLTNVANAQTLRVTLNSVNSASNVTIPMSVLVGDTNANATVNAADVAQTKARLGQAVDATNYRSDINTNGSINAADTAIVKQNSGTSLPP